MLSLESVTIESFSTISTLTCLRLATATSARQAEPRDEPVTHTKALFLVGLILPVSFSPIPENSAAPNISGPLQGSLKFERIYADFAAFARCLRQASNPTAPTASNASEPGSGI